MSVSTEYQYEFVNAIADVRETDWQQLNTHQSPFTHYRYLRALEDTGCASDESGWSPHHLLVRDQSELVAAMPLYRKTHSYGEYVFDWRWAEAYEHSGHAYFPKLVTAIPFTPVPGARVLFRDTADPDSILGGIIHAIQQRCETAQLSSWHLLFPNESLTQTLADTELLHRTAVQFHWFNRGFRTFDDFLASLRSSKRKQIRRERRRVSEQGIDTVRLLGSAITESAMRDFYFCYRDTYLKRSGHSGYLSLDFFQAIRQQLADQLMLVGAYRNGKMVASSLFFFDRTHLYGRYWGALEDVDCLHFECCYYQGIEFAIATGLQCFNPGTQGEHKLIRGFEPVQTHSFHWLSNPEFADAVARFLAAERQHTERYQAAAASALPFKHAES